MVDFYLVMAGFGIIVVFLARLVHVIDKRIVKLEKQCSDIQKQLISSNNQKEAAQIKFQADVVAMFEKLTSRADVVAMFEKLTSRIDGLYGLISK